MKSLETNTTTYKKTQEMNTINLLKCIINIYDIKIFKQDFKSKKIINCGEQNKSNILKNFIKD